MIITIVFLAVISLFALNFTYRSWIVPWMIKHDGHRFEPGRDDEVSATELLHRSAWRYYDSWTERIMSLVFDALLIVMLILVLSGK